MKTPSDVAAATTAHHSVRVTIRAKTLVAGDTILERTARGNVSLRAAIGDVDLHPHCENGYVHAYVTVNGARQTFCYHGDAVVEVAVR